MNKRFINTLKLLDNIAGPFFLKLCIRRYKKSSIFKNILIIRPGGIGDAALLLPSIKRLKRLFPSIEIDILCESRNRGIFDSAHYIKNIFNYWSVRDVIKIMNKEYDLVIDTEQSHLLSTFFVNSFIKAHKRVGFSSNKRGSYYDISIPYFHEEYELKSFSRLFLSIIPEWKVDYLLEPPYIYVSEAQKKKIEELVSFTKRPVACIFAGASIYLRRWMPERWAKVAERLWDIGFYPVLLGSRYEKEINRKIKDYSNAPIVDLTERLNLAEIAELFRKSRLLLSIDSGILHIAVIEGLSTISLFGPGIAEKWGPKGDNHIIIRKDIECSPCTRFGNTPVCKNNGICMKLISVDDVLYAIEKIVTQSLK